MKISVILCTWNNSSRLNSTLSYFQKIKVPSDLSWELILVDNNSQDDTADVAKKFEPALPLKYVFEPVQGLSKARNTGIGHANGQYVLFTDDDVIPCDDWLVEYYHFFLKHPEDYYCGGEVIPHYEGEKPPQDLLKYAPDSVKGFYADGFARKGYAFLSANWACPMNALTSAGGFNESLGLNSNSGCNSREETDLMQRLYRRGYVPKFLPKAKLEHLIPPEKSTVSFIIQKKISINGAKFTQLYLNYHFFPLLWQLIKTSRNFLVAYCKLQILVFIGHKNRWAKEHIIASYKGRFVAIKNGFANLFRK